MSLFHEIRRASVDRETIEQRARCDLEASKKCGVRSPRTTGYPLTYFESEQTHWEPHEQNDHMMVRGRYSRAYDYDQRRMVADIFESNVVERRQSDSASGMQDLNESGRTNSVTEDAHTGSSVARNARTVKKLKEKGPSPHTLVNERSPQASINERSPRISVNERSNLTLQSHRSVSFANDVEEMLTKSRNSRSLSREETIGQGNPFRTNLTRQQHPDEEIDELYQIPVSGRSVSWGDDSVYEIKEYCSDDNDVLDVRYLGATPGQNTESDFSQLKRESWTDARKIPLCLRPDLHHHPKTAHK
ncbi:hypothetical protein BJ742DRAFT_734874 [Cladochytrium replicatum]|nr:hypothetical protein BJ742DRAFT_734874 [Cladochytrium replicatum]